MDYVIVEFCCLCGDKGVLELQPENILGDAKNNISIKIKTL